MTNLIIPSVNFHLWEPCNMRCGFCFATFQDVKQSVLPKGHLPKAEAIEIVRLLADFGFEKITFAGGEPTLCAWLPDLIATAKKFGLTTMVVTNGTKLTDKFLQNNKPYLDWIAISIDSLNQQTNLESGRAIAGNKTLSINYYRKLVDQVKENGYGLKINTVVSRNNFKENMAEFIEYANPIRWKVLQVLPIVGQNSNRIENFKIDDNEFNVFINNHSSLRAITHLVTETNDQIKGSYAMVDPAGRFFDNSKGIHNYSEPILTVGVKVALQEVNYNFLKYLSRGGQYDWKRETLK